MSIKIYNNKYNSTNSTKSTKKIKKLLILERGGGDIYKTFKNQKSFKFKKVSIQKLFYLEIPKVEIK